MLEQWSLVITEFIGRPTQWRSLAETVPRIFGRHGLDVFTLAAGRDVLPAEILDCLPYERAVQIARDLETFGVKAEAVLSSQTDQVRYRAAEVWATRASDDHEFTELDGMIFAAPALNARRNLAVLRKAHHNEWQDWRYERGLNHRHADASWTELPPRERVREEVKLAHHYETILRTVYPNISFVISHAVGDSVSFCQAKKDAPVVSVVPKQNNWEKVWCVHCHHQQPYRLRGEPDAEYPAAQWGECLACENEVLVASEEVLWFINCIPE